MQPTFYLRHKNLTLHSRETERELYVLTKKDNYREIEMKVPWRSKERGVRGRERVRERGSVKICRRKFNIRRKSRKEKKRRIITTTNEKVVKLVT